MMAKVLKYGFLVGTIAVAVFILLDFPTMGPLLTTLRLLIFMVMAGGVWTAATVLLSVFDNRKME